MLSLQQPAECEDQTDEQIQEKIDMHGTYWLDECKYILTIMVHRKNPVFTGEVADLSAGPSRQELRQMEARRVEKERLVSADERERAVNVRVERRVDERIEARARELKVKESVAAESIIASKERRLENKLKLLEKHKEIYVRRHGSAKYEDMVDKLIEDILACGEDQNEEGKREETEEGKQEETEDEEEEDGIVPV